MRLKHTPLVFALGMIVVMGMYVPADKGDKNPVNVDKQGVTIKGYDAVAYFTENKPVKGSKNFSYEWNHAIWYFSSGENRDIFVSDPNNYAPQYGGYCAYALAHGDLVDIDPHSWKIVDGKLYLNFNKKIHKKWGKNIPGYIEKADENWPDILQK